MSYIQDIRTVFSSSDILAIELIHSTENIFNLLVFSDENDNIHKMMVTIKIHTWIIIFQKIRKDIEWYSSVYTDIKHQFDMTAVYLSMWLMHCFQNIFLSKRKRDFMYGNVSNYIVLSFNLYFSLKISLKVIFAQLLNIPFRWYNETNKSFCITSQFILRKILRSINCEI